MSKVQCYINSIFQENFMSVLEHYPTDLGQTNLWYSENSYLLREHTNSIKRGENTRDCPTHLLLKVSPILLVNKDKVEIIPCAKLLIHVPECGRQVEAAEE